MTEADARAHPWPLKGCIDFRFRRAVFAEIAPMYNQAGESWRLLDIQRAILMRGRYPFLTWNFGTWFGREFKGYVGWKPISPYNDPAFYWQSLSYVQSRMAEGALFTQLSVRGATGAVAVVAIIAVFIIGMFTLARGL